MKVLALDGGGIRGLIPALVLAEVEARTGRRMSDLVDLIAGTSTGGLLACGLSRPQPMSAAALAEAYERDGPRIFRRSLLKRIFSLEGWIDERYEDDGLEDALERHLGTARLSETTVDVFVTAYDIEARAAFFFRSSRARTDPRDDHRLVDVARATAAAPTYFEPARVGEVALIDGGVYAANPSLVAYVDVLRAGGELTLLASLGTGQSTEPIRYEQARWWGQLEWARPVLSVVFDGIAETTEFSLATLLEDRYVRLQPVLGEASDALDDASEGNLAALRRDAERLIAERSADIDRLCVALTA